jgi:photosystem II stability/assembly factor-like uncharacterized protein
VQSVQAVNADKVSFQVFEIDSPLLDIIWCGQSNDVIIVQSEAGTVYRSRDRGDSWKKLHSIMHQTGMSVLDEGQTVSAHVTVKFCHLGHWKSQEDDAVSSRRVACRVHR